MNNWQDDFAKENIFFVTPDVKRGVGFGGILPSYHVICTDFDPLIPILKKQGANIFCLETDSKVDITKIRNSGKLLELPQVLEYVNSHTQVTPKILYFKPSLKLDELIKKYGFIPIGNNSTINELFEDKISFFQIAQEELSANLVPGTTGILGELEYGQLTEKFGSNFVTQFGHGWAGKTTFFINSESTFTQLQEKFSYTKVKINKYIRGFTVLNNCCIYQDQVLISPPAIQIDSVGILADSPGVTCGRQWPVKYIDKNEIEKISEISQTVGRLMEKQGFGGFFGIDFLIEETGRIYLSEVNPRLTASSAFFTLMELGLNNIPLMAYHMAEFLGKTLVINKENEEIIASQLIFRKPIDLSSFNHKLFGVYKYTNDKQIPAGESYYPQNLRKDEYVFMARKKINKESDNEFARLETKNEILEEPKKLKDWVRKLISGS